ncbi:MAG: hypothetical protein QXT50_04050 [Thermofilum sp.]
MERRWDRLGEVWEKRRRRLAELKDRRLHITLVFRLCFFITDILRAAAVLEPLKPIEKWVFGRPTPAALLSVASKPMVIVEETGAVRLCNALSIQMFDPIGIRIWLLLASPTLALLSERAVKTILVHELLHMAGITSEEEVEQRVREAARLKPDLFASIEEVDREVREEAVQVVLLGEPLVDMHILPSDPSRLTFRDLLPLISVQISMERCFFP